jgi:hypothetical protein
MWLYSTIPSTILKTIANVVKLTIYSTSGGISIINI